MVRPHHVEGRLDVGDHVVEGLLVEGDDAEAPPLRAMASSAQSRGSARPGRPGMPSRPTASWPGVTNMVPVECEHTTAPGSAPGSPRSRCR